MQNLYLQSNNSPYMIGLSISPTAFNSSTWFIQEHVCDNMQLLKQSFPVIITVPLNLFLLYLHKICSALAAFVDCFSFIPGDRGHECCSPHWCALDQRQRGRKLLLLLWRLSQVCCLSEIEHADHPCQAHQIRRLRAELLPGGFSTWSTVTLEQLGFFSFSFSFFVFFWDLAQIWSISHRILTLLLQPFTAEQCIHQQGEI